MNIFDFDALAADIPRDVAQTAWREYFYALQDELAEKTLAAAKRKKWDTVLVLLVQLDFFFPETAAWLREQYRELQSNVVPDNSLVWQTRTSL